jgi:hypothetical protein
MSELYFIKMLIKIHLHFYFITSQFNVAFHLTVPQLKANTWIRSMRKWRLAALSIVLKHFFRTFPLHSTMWTILLLDVHLILLYVILLLFLYFVFCILYFVFCILYFVFCILYFVFCILYFVFCIFCILYFVFCIFCIL